MELKEKIFNIKNHIGKISKDSTNPFHNSKYFDINKLLEIVEPLLVEQRILLTQPIKENRVYTVLYDLDSKEEEISYLDLPINTDPQKTGICVTYFRRYTLKSLLGIQEEDDDGNGAVKREPKKETAKAELYTLTEQDVANKWNGKIYSNKYVYIDGKKVEPPKEQIDKLLLHTKYKKD